MLHTMLFYKVFKVSISHRNIVKNVTYTAVLAIFRFPKRGHFGRTNIVFFIRFGSDRKSLRCYVYRHFSDFEVSKNAFLFVFARRRFWTSFWILIGKCASNSHTYAKWDPPFKIELPKKGRTMRSRIGQKSDLGGPFSAWSGGPKCA